MMYMSSRSLYNRAELDGLMEEYLGNARISEAITDEILFISYSFNNQQPRFYSKWFADKQPAIYDVKLGDGSAASSSAPVVFPPREHIDGHGFYNYEVDGAMIANNPAFYAY